MPCTGIINVADLFDFTTVMNKGHSISVSCGMKVVKLLVIWSLRWICVIFDIISEKYMCSEGEDSAEVLKGIYVWLSHIIICA